MSRPHAAAPASSARATTPAAPRVAPLHHRVRADLLVVARQPLTPRTQQALRRNGLVRRMLVVDGGHVRIGGGRTFAVGVDASRFRGYAAPGTAEVDALWQSIARGDVAVAHPVATALRLPLGGSVRIGHGRTVTERVGAFATTGLPGVGAVASRELTATLHLVPDSVAVLSLRAAGDAPDAAAALRRAVGGAARVVTVQRFVTVTRAAAWVAPAAGRITSGFGLRRFPLDPRRQDFHPGIDIAAPLGAPVWAAASGSVVYAGPAAGFGNEIILLHADGVTTVYGHMSRLLVTAGTVRAGQAIALVGSEGESTGPHLHFEVHVRDQRVDPLAWLRTHGVGVR